MAGGYGIRLLVHLELSHGVHLCVRSLQGRVDPDHRHRKFGVPRPPIGSASRKERRHMFHGAARANG